MTPNGDNVIVIGVNLIKAVAQAAQGAGIQTAERLAGLGVQAVMSGYVGPKAFTALKAAGLDVYQDMDNRSVGEAVRCLADGSVSPATAPNK